MKDLYGREITYMRVSVTELCSLRCLYCMPKEGIPKRPHCEMMTEEETLMTIRAAASLGIKKIRITGGEPLEKRNILSICEKTAATPGIEEVCLTTNALKLPKFAKDLKAAGINHINISLDTLDPEKYTYITRIGKLDKALEGIECALSTGFKIIKINSVLIGGFNDNEIRSLAELTLKYPIDVRFIELMPMVGEAQFTPDAFISYEKVLEQLPEAVPVPHDGGVAKLYRLPDGKGRIGVISPLNSHFCAECSRLRLTADGKLKPCLHSPDEYSIRGMNEDQVRAQLIAAINGKPLMHSPLSATEMSMAKREMVRIGG